MFRRAMFMHMLLLCIFTTNYQQIGTCSNVIQQVLIQHVIFRHVVIHSVLDMNECVPQVSQNTITR